jgi:uncharacterized Fe-S radical SAM superfamily protein PflX
MTSSIELAHKKKTRRPVVFNCNNMHIPVFLNMKLHRVVNVYSASINKYENEPYGEKQPLTYARGGKKKALD